MSLNDLFHRLATTRSRYEDLRANDGDFGERARLQSELHNLRARIAAERHEIF